MLMVVTYCIQHYSTMNIIIAGVSQQCYSQANCVAGSEIDVPGVENSTAKDCCVGTNHGQSFANSDGVCSVTQCIG